MDFLEESTEIRSKHHLRIPMPQAGEDFELFMFTGIAVFDELKGAGNSWSGGNVTIVADYSHLFPGNRKAIHLKNWTVDVGLSSISNDKHAVNTGWSVNVYSLKKTEIDDNEFSAVQGGFLRVNAGIAISDIDAKILRLSYNVSILGKVIESPVPPID